MKCGALDANYIDLFRGKSVPKQFGAEFNLCGPLDGGALEVHCNSKQARWCTDEQWLDGLSK